MVTPKHRIRAASAVGGEGVLRFRSARWGATTGLPSNFARSAFEVDGDRHVMAALFTRRWCSGLRWSSRRMRRSRISFVGLLGRSRVVRDSCNGRIGRPSTCISFRRSYCCHGAMLADRNVRGLISLMSLPLRTSRIIRVPPTNISAKISGTSGTCGEQLRAPR